MILAEARWQRDFDMSGRNLQSELFVASFIFECTFTTITYNLFADVAMKGIDEMPKLLSVICILLSNTRSQARRQIMRIKKKKK